MTSNYLTRPIRSRQQVLRETIAALLEGDSYFVIDAVMNGQPFVREIDLGRGLRETVSDIASGEYDFKLEGPCGVLRVGRGEVEDVTEKVAIAVLEYLIQNDQTHDGDGHLIARPFLDNTLPDWESQVHPGIMEKQA